MTLATCVCARFRTLRTLLTAAILFPAFVLSAQVPVHRLSHSFDTSSRVELPNTFSKRISRASALGHLDGQTQLSSMMLVLKPTAEQEANLDKLLVDQQDPSSPQYHKWLTPAQFGARFGVSDDDLSVLKQWLSNAGFQVVSVPESKNAIIFSGNSATVESAFGTTMQRYRGDGQQFFQNSGNIKVPAAFTSVITGIGNLSSYRPQHFSHVRSLGGSVEGSIAGSATPLYNNSNATHSLSPWDFQQIYGMRPLLSSGFDGTGVSIAVLGQSAVSATQLGYFQTLTGQTAKLPTAILVSGSNVASSGDEGESEVDLEYASGTAPGASIFFVYDTQYGVFNAMLYAIVNNVAPIMTLSYGTCEVDEAQPSGTQPSDIAIIEPYLRQANAQGQTLVVATGDWDAATCDEIRGGDFTVATQGATISYPASSPYATAIGGTMLNDTSANWASTNNAQAGSALGYIPEVVWNETSVNSQGGYAALGTGGGVSRVFSKPSWQVGTGVPTDGRRDIPDISFSSAVYHDAYLYCSADSTTQACTTTSFSQSRIGGTSLAAPNFAAMLAVIESSNGGTALGNINPLLYRSFAVTPAAYQDVTTGDNKVACGANTEDCVGGVLGYAATAGYDPVSGLGSVNASVLATTIAALPSAVTAPALSITQSVTALTVNQSVTYTAVVSGAGSATPSGTVAFSVDGGTPTSVTLVAESGSDKAATAAYTLTSGFATAGSHTVTAVYSGDTNYLTATSSFHPNVFAALTGSFTLASSPATLSIVSGSSANETLTITSVGGFADSVDFSVGSSNIPSSITTLCYSLLRTGVAAGGTANATMTISTSPTFCANASGVTVSLAHPSQARNTTPSSKLPVVLFASLLLGCLGMRRSRSLKGLLVLCLTAGMLGAIGCGSSGTSGSGGGGGGSTGGTASITMKGTSVRDASISATTSFTVTVQ